jgi:(1->4)-alpha-D-glucan 1-alpha-D-glucosylmutase
MGPEEATAFTGRIQQYMLKASKEAKLNTSWINPNATYDEALQNFVARILDPRPDNRFLADFTSFHRPIARLGMLNSLAQVLIKSTAPGVPDFYQGSEMWDFSLVDPDNRRPVEFTARAALLAGLQERVAAGDQDGLARELVEHWADSRIKLYTIHRALYCRRQAPILFQAGDYVPLSTVGDHAAHVCAFARRRATGAVLTVVPRLTGRLTDNGARLPVGRDVWGDTRVLLPRDFPGQVYLNLFTGAEVRPTGSDSGMSLALGEILVEFPVALLDAGPPLSAPVSIESS